MTLPQNGTTRTLIWIALATVIVLNTAVSISVMAAMRTVAQATDTWRGIEQLKADYEVRMNRAESQITTLTEMAALNARRITKGEIGQGGD